MHREVDRALGQGFLNLLGEHALGAHLGEGRVLQPVAGGFDDRDFDRVVFRTQKVGDMMSLPERQLRPSTADAQPHLRPTVLGSPSALFRVLVSASGSGEISGKAGGGSDAGGKDQASQSASTLALSLSRAACLR